MEATQKQKTDSVIIKSLPWFALVAVVAAGAIFVQTMLFYLNSNEATCTVLAVDVLRGSGSSGNTTYRPTIQYTDDQGVRHVVAFVVATSYYNFSVGQDVAILYDPNDPQSVRFNTFMGVWGLTTGIAFAAVVIVLIAGASKAAQRQMQRKKAIGEGKIIPDDKGHSDLPPH